MQTSLLRSRAQGFAIEEDYEYALVVSPTEDVNALVAEEMRQFYAAYKHKAATLTRPHIVVTKFFAKQAMEETIIRYMRRIAAMQKSFLVMLNNYSCNPVNNIFIRVQEQEPFKQLFDALAPVNQYIQRSGYPAATRIARPHIALAKKLQQQVYYKAIFDYSQKSFNASFIVNELILLKRRTHFDEFKQVNIFKLADNE
ncbi:MAG TPA: 2'-5' RNA ligase family protein [Chitinophagaceae bacterium]|nr:2'-5' RNA ligase family protein [Chitinophagaceae bacterium]